MILALLVLDAVLGSLALFLWWLNRPWWHDPETVRLYHAIMADHYKKLYADTPPPPLPVLLAQMRLQSEQANG